MKKNFKMAALALGAMTAGVLASCTAESGYLNEPTAPEATPFVNLVKGTEVTAFANGFVIPTTAESAMPWTISADGVYDYNFPVDMQKAESIEVPSTAVKYNGQNQGSGTYYVDGTYDGGISFADNSTLTIYVKDGSVVKNMGSNFTSVELYICPGAEVTLEPGAYSTGSWNIYNAGKLTLPNGITSSNIKNIFNTGSLYVTNQYGGSSLAAGVSVYSSGYVQFATNGGEWSKNDIMGTLVSSNIVESKGKIKFQNSQRRDICWLIADDLVEITDNTNIFGKIEAESIQFDGASIKLHPEGLIKTTKEIVVHNSGCHIYSYDSNSRGLVICPSFTSENPPLSEIFSDGIYLNTGKINEKEGGIMYDKTNSSTINNRVNVVEETDLADPCGNVNVDDEEDPIIPGIDPKPLPGVDPEIPEIEFPDPLDPGFTVPSESQKPKEHVEVNLEVEEHQDYLASHLSIHVRAVTDVEVFIPVPATYYVEADDMAIVEQHFDGMMIHGGPDVTTYNINGNIVTLTVAFEEGGIRVTTSGINEEVIGYLQAKTGDGLTFEVWNYYNENALGETLEEGRIKLKELLDENHATVEFTNEPPLYVNAFFFGDKYVEGEWSLDKDVKNPWDCTVDIVESQAGDYNAPETGSWFNGAPYNELQTKK